MSMQSTDVGASTDAGIWYKNPMVLMVIAIPLVAVIVSFTMLAIAIKTFDGVVVDDYYRQGKEINRILERDEMAVNLGLQAIVEFEHGTLLVSLESVKHVNWPDELVLRILHPTQAGRDLTIELERQYDQRYAGTVSDITTGEWFVQIDTPEWRLTNRAKLSNNSQIVLNNSRSDR